MAALCSVALGTLGACQGGVDEPTRSRASQSPASAPVSATPHPPRSSATPEPPRSPAGSQPATPRDDALGALPAVPTRRSAATLADQIESVEGVVGDPDAPNRDVRRAGEFAQLAARLLATAPEQFRRGVLTRLPPKTRAKTRLDVEAASLLDAMTSPQRRLPEWRIVAPPAAQELLGHYRFAARRIGVPWTYLAAIHLVETRMGRIRGVSSAGAQGPMQFLPTTWDLYGAGGDINDPRDAILAAARLLRANGAPQDMAGAVWHYNPSDNYVGAVTRYAEAMRNSTVAYRGYWHWRVLFKHVRGTYVLERGYPQVPARLLG
jgi:membrane-bound lytic murein transglycosylase B